MNEKERFPIVTLLGKGGIGKTTTALKCLHSISKSEEFDLIIWFSSRDIDLSLDGPKAVKSKVFNIQDIAVEFCNLLEFNSKSTESKIEYFKKNLTQSPHGKILYVFDNFETIDDPLEVYNWLYTFIRHPNKILITSRESRDFKADYPIEIGRMEHDECEKLIDIYTGKFGVKDIVSTEYIDKLIDESNGHPYIIKILIGEVAKSKKEVKIKRIVAGRDDILTALFRRTFDTLSPSAIRVFLTLCSWRSAVSKLALEAVLLRPDNEERIDVEEGVEELRKSSFIDVFKSELDNSEFISVPLAASIFGKNELQVYSERIAVLNDRELLLQFGHAKENDFQKGLKPFVVKKFSQIGKLIEKKKMKEKVPFLLKQVPILEYINTHYNEGWLLLGDLYKELNLAENYIECLLQYIKANPSSSEKRMVWRKLASIYKSHGDWKKESHALSEICILPDTHISEISNISNRLITRIKNSENIDKEHKEIIINTISDVFEKRINESSNGDDYSILAWLFVHLKKLDKAKKYTNMGLKVDPTNTYCLQLMRKLSNKKRKK